jgi:prephenate dehydrogenase
MMAIVDALAQLDQHLIQLLGKRLSLLNAAGIPPMQEQLADPRSHLAQAQVPESIWSAVVIGCMAALANDTPAAPQATEPRRITVVGGEGAMGRFFTKQLSLAGHQTTVLEASDWDNAEVLLGSADLVLLCVPLKRTVDIIRKVSPYLSPNTVLADIASTKTTSLQAMMDCHAGPVMGLHPMFGPGVESFLKQKVVVCPGRNATAAQWFLDWMETEGGQLISCTPEEHDRLMVVVQAIRHFSTFSLGVFLAEEGVAIDRSLEFASPLYRNEINAVSRLFAQDGALYIDIMLASEERCEAIQRLVETSDRLATLLAQRERASLMAEFDTAREAFQGEAKRALKESNYLINSLSTFLAASQLNVTSQTSQQEWERQPQSQPVAA